MAHRRVPSDKRVNRGHPTQEGEQAGVAFLLVTFLWPRKEKSLAKPRSGGETLSRTESSCPAQRSRANTLLQGRNVTYPLTLALSRKGRGNGYRGRLRSANRPYSTPPIDPKASPASGEGTVTADDYALLLDPTRPDSTIPIAPSVVSAWGHGQSPGGRRGCPSRVQPSYLVAGAGDRLVCAKDAAAPDCRRHLAPLTIHEYSGPTGADGYLTEPASAGPSKSMKLVMQLSELNGFSPLLQSGNRRLTRGRGVMEDERRARLMSGEPG